MKKSLICFPNSGWRVSHGLPPIHTAENHAEDNGFYLQVIICPFWNWITKFLWIIHFGVACPEQWSNASPISTADIKKIPALLGGGGDKFFDISQTEEIIGFLKRGPVRGTEGSCLFVGGVSSSGATEQSQEQLPGGWPCLLWMQLQASAVDVPRAVGEQAQISIYPRSFKNCIPDKFCENGSVPGGQRPSHQQRFCCCQDWSMNVTWQEEHTGAPQPVTLQVQASNYFLFPIFLLGW